MGYKVTRIKRNDTVSLGEYNQKQLHFLNNTDRTPYNDQIAGVSPWVQCEAPQFSVGLDSPQ